ncbi:hypothetical protein CHUAL_001306 [Chamberlinius hualienensis]
MDTKLINILAAILVLLVTFFGHLLRAECQCGIFVISSTANDSIREVYLSETLPQACERLEMDLQCHDFCYSKVVNVSVDGNMSSFSLELGSTVGETFCRNLRTGSYQVAGYYRWCQTAWKQMLTPQTPLCCQQLHYVRCRQEELITHAQ